jgi:type II secretory pathway pseudopilin PulG
MAERENEAGFGLLEVIVCVALLVIGSAMALALVPSIARASQTQLLREGATNVARNALERARAASAYAPPAAMSADGAAAATIANHAWAFAPAATYASAVRIRRALCGAGGTTTDVAVTVTITYDPASDAVTAAVAYPPDPCRPQRDATVSLTAELAPAAAAPQTRMTTPIADPDQQ